jgi:iron complex transport system substrate-binding protein
MVNYPSADAWSVYGGRNAFARLIKDAGGQYPWESVDSRASLHPVSFESAFAAATDSDCWIIGPDPSPTRLAKGIEDYRLRDSRAVRKGCVYISFVPNAEGKNPYWDQALLRPDLELADYIRVLHPDLLPEHQLHFLRAIAAPGS